MILTKAKENVLDLISGVKTINFNFIESLSSGNYWVDWAENFISVCQDTLGLEVEKGPGTSIGIVQANEGGIIQFDCDWTQKNGRVPEHEYYEEPISLWEDADLWNNGTNSTSGGEDDNTEISLLNLGLDKKNKRFDFIVWFTTNDGEEAERLGLRFKYPLTSSRVFGTCYYISPAPCCLPWKKIDTGVNNMYRAIAWETIPNSRIGLLISSTDFNNSLKYITTFNQAALTLSSDIFYNVKNRGWNKYSEFPKDDEIEYNQLGGTFSSYQGANPVSNYRGANIFDKVEIIVSKNKRVVDFQIKNANNDILFDILYGDLVVDENENIKSFIMVTNQSSSNYMANFLLTEKDYVINPPKQVNRYNVQTVNLSTYCGISRVLLQNQILHCQELYQVFNFGTLMNTQHYYNQVFVDKEQNEHQFIVFNYGSNLINSSTNYNDNSVAFAVPI